MDILTIATFSDSDNVEKKHLSGYFRHLDNIEMKLVKLRNRLFSESESFIRYIYHFLTMLGVIQFLN